MERKPRRDALICGVGGFPGTPEVGMEYRLDRLEVGAIRCAE